jgi:hypothetical protein
MRRRRLGYRVCAVVLTLVVGGAAVEATGTPVYGVHSRHATASHGGWSLDVHYGDRSRPALATPFDIVVHHDGGFDGPVTVAVTSEYLAMWDENGLDPAPSEETTDAERTIWTFDVPDDSATMAIGFDGRIEPAAQSGESARVAVLDDDGTELVAVDIETVVLP